MIGNRDKELIRMATAATILIVLSLAALVAGHSSPPLGKSFEWLNEKTVLFLAVAMVASGVAVWRIRGLRFRFVAVALLLNALVAGTVIAQLSLRDRRYVSFDDVGHFLVFMLVTFLMGYLVPRIFARQRGRAEN